MLYLVPLALMVILTGVWFSYKLWQAIVRFRITLQGPFYCPVSEDRLETLMKLAQIKPGMKVADLGSGDGRILLAVAQAGATAVGFEIDAGLIKQSRAKIKAAGLEKKAKVLSESFWDADLSGYDLITIYCTQRFMPKLARKLEKELKPGTRVISVYFTLTGWKHELTENEVHLYVTP